MKTEHTHTFKPHKTVVPLHNYITEDGKIIKDLITGKDTLKQLKCACGKTTTMDLVRSV